MSQWMSRWLATQNLFKIAGGIAISGFVLLSAPLLEARTQNTSAAVVPFQRPAALAQAAAPGQAGGQASDQVQMPVQGDTQVLHLMVGRSLVITSPTRIKRVSVADPSIADAIVVSPTQVLVNGKIPGGVSLMLWDDSDQSQAFEVSVDIDILSLRPCVIDRGGG
jgi:Flp pilus assembly secretin CpaC